MLNTAAGRIFLAALSLAIGLVLFHTQIADALVVRGDDMLVQNAYDQAAQRYSRALRFDPDSVVAIDRLAFVALQGKRADALRLATDRASEYLRTHPAEPKLLFDRALCYLKQKHYLSAYADFLRAAQLTHDPEQYTFAGWAARRTNKLAQAVDAWRRALRIRPGYRPAAAALSEQEK
ncbi:MAG TPA: hypothetical protein VFW34_08195 [Candidatus Rubrimentiphilum sp.]|nr:hypothetical protein [Candidatus Rubrimentiphilum sp.]